MPVAAAGGAEIYYEVHGQGDPVLLVPGLSGLGSYWQPQLAEFGRRYRVVVHDHRGTGRSSRSRIAYSVEQMTEDLIAVMDAVGIARAHLVGQSTGGAIGQVVAIDHPDRVRSLVLSSTWTRADAFFRRCFAARKAILLGEGPAAYAQASALFIYPNWWISANADRLARDEQAGLATFPPVEIVASRIDAILAFDRTAALGQIRAPTLVICARDDHLTPAYFSEELAKTIPGAALALLDRGGHAASQISAGEWNRLVLEFLEAH
jgi:aminoacrylate hydrolase